MQTTPSLKMFFTWLRQAINVGAQSMTEWRAECKYLLKSKRPSDLELELLLTSFDHIVLICQQTKVLGKYADVLANKIAPKRIDLTMMLPCVHFAKTQACYPAYLDVINHSLDLMALKFLHDHQYLPALRQQYDHFMRVDSLVDNVVEDWLDAEFSFVAQQRHAFRNYLIQTQPAAIYSLWYSYRPLPIAFIALLELILVNAIDLIVVPDDRFDQVE